MPNGLPGACFGYSDTLLAGSDIAERERRVTAEEYEPLKARDGPLMTLVVILVVLWLLGMVTTYTLGGLLHILLVIAVILLLVRVIQGRSI